MRRTKHRGRLEFLSGAFLGGAGGESRPALLHIVAAAMWTGQSPLLIIKKSQDLRECFLARVTEELVVGHVRVDKWRQRGCNLRGQNEARLMRFK